MNEDSDRALAAVLAGFAHTLGTDFSVEKILDRLVREIVGILPVTGAGVMLMGPGDALHFIAASDETITSIETLQNELDEGPCLRAYRTGEPVAVEDLTADTEFPEFSPRAVEAGLAAVFTFPMRLDDHRLGAVDLYRDTPGPLAEDDLRAGQVLTDVAAAFVFNAQARIGDAAAVAVAEHRSLHDPLTGLANRVLLEELLTRAVARAGRSHHPAAVLFADLDGFKSVNDRWGHDVGDQLLRAVADRLTGALRPGDTLARLAGDEFVILCEDLIDSGDAEIVAERVTTVLTQPFTLDGRVITVAASVGIAFTGPGQDLPRLLLRAADVAMYQAKQRGGGQHRVLDRNARAADDRRNTLDRDLRHAQDRGQLTLLYQPIHDLPTEKLVGAEALLRWEHPDRGTVPAPVIISAAEHSGLIIPIGEWVLRRACTDLRRWQQTRSGIPMVAVNVSAQQILHPGFLDLVHRVLIDTRVEPATVVLEITESVFLADAPRALTVTQGLKALGVQLSLDDFGTGYSSLNYLRQYPFDVVKIDRSFTADVPGDPVTRSVVTAMVDLSHALGLTVTAEGVETPAELDAVTTLHADHVQGYLLSRPLTAGALTDYAAAHPDPPSPSPQPPSVDSPSGSPSDLPAATAP